MKHFLPLFIFASISFSQKEYNTLHIVEQEGVWYKKFSDEIVNGVVFMEFDGMKITLGKMINGKKDGTWTFWYPSGTKKSIENFISYT